MKTLIKKLVNQGFEDVSIPFTILERKVNPYTERVIRIEVYEKDNIAVNVFMKDILEEEIGNAESLEECNQLIHEYLEVNP